MKRIIVAPSSSPASSQLHLFSPSSNVLLSAQRTYFVRHRKTPNPDCMMFHVSSFSFRIGSQEKLAAYLLDKQKRENAAAADDGDDWDGPGPIKNAAARHAQDEKRREENVRKAQELRQKSLRAYVTQSAAETKLRQEEAEQLVMRNRCADDSGDSDALSAACENAAGDFQAVGKTLNVPSRTAGAGVVSLASRPKRPDDAALADPFQPDIDEDASSAAGISVISATYSFAPEEKHLSPLAKRIFECDAGASVAEVVVGKDFVTVRRKSDEELEEEHEREQERKRLAEERGEKGENQPTHEAVVTSLSTLSGMVAKGGNNNNVDGAKDRKGDDNTVADTREKLAEMYRESDAAKKAATEEKMMRQQQDSAASAAAHADADAAGGGTKVGSIALPAAGDAGPAKAAEWLDLLFELSGAVTDHLYFNEVAVDLCAKHPYADTEIVDGDSEIVSAIKELISGHLRPLLQSDGGDIKFHGYDEQGAVLKVEMLGSCKTCKKSDTTLKDLIERTIQHFVPEVKHVQEIAKMRRLLRAQLQKQQQQREREAE